MVRKENLSVNLPGINLCLWNFKGLGNVYLNNLDVSQSIDDTLGKTW